MKARALEVSRLPTAATEPEEEAGASARARSPRTCARPVGWDDEREWRNW